ncbi:major capsid protein [Roseibium sediminicola]|uniref:Major capsid protein n=1 Tax=Roseibium sediminicola TaxID=2933272 RepID=A0ABT0GR99_9HYPH|nr:major capsid protein [Roseibium sp. CAU 1639]MCK7611971.1 major capsid protein [Roseibium sp. CAU 1639]
MPEILFPYTNVELTEEVNRIPNLFGLLNALNLAPGEPMASRMVRIDYRDGQLVVLAAEEPGAPGQMSEQDNVGGTILTIPHFPHLETIKAEDLAGGLEVINGVLQARNLDTETAQRLSRIRNHHSVTLEYIRMGMLRGLIKDGKGRTLYNLFTVLNLTKKTVDFKLGTPATKVIEKCEEVIDHVLSNLKGETSTQIECIVSSAFFNKLVAHANVEKFWIQTQNAPTLQNMERDRLGGNWGRVFEFGQILFREYKGTFPVRGVNGAITSEAAVESGKGHAYPSGTQNLFRTYQSPAHHIEMVNIAPNADDPIYISTKVLDHGSGVEMKSQSNRLAVCKQPNLLVEVYSSD